MKMSSTAKKEIVANLKILNHATKTIPGPEVIKLLSCSTQLSTKFQLLLKLKYRQMKKCIALNLSDVVFIMLLNVILPTIVGILTVMGRIHS